MNAVRGNNKDVICTGKRRSETFLCVKLHLFLTNPTRSKNNQSVFFSRSLEFQKERWFASSSLRANLSTPVRGHNLNVVCSVPSFLSTIYLQRTVTVAIAGDMPNSREFSLMPSAWRHEQK